MFKHTSDFMRLSIIVPCYNEAATVREILERTLRVELPPGWEREIIVVDDGSTDGTSSIVRSLQNKHTLLLLSHSNNRGKGAAVKTGLASARGEYVLIQDADAEYDPADYVALIAGLRRGQSVFGSRNLGSNNVPYNAVYYYGGLLVSKLSNLLFGTHLSDIASCYKLFPSRFIPELLKSGHDDFVFDAVVLTDVLVRGGSIAEVPISYHARTKADGKKLNARHATKIVAALLLYRFGLGSAASTAFIAQVIRFLMVGGSAAAVHVTSLFVLTEFANIWYLYSSMFAFIAAFSFNFLAQKYWVFGSDDHGRIPIQLPLHLGMALMNLGINIGLLYALVEFAGIWYVLAQLIASALIATLSFVLLRWIFKK